jgi:hypothetical protein
VWLVELLSAHGVRLWGRAAQWTVELLDESPCGDCSARQYCLLRVGVERGVEGLLGVWCVGTLLGPEITPAGCCSVPGPGWIYTADGVVRW